MWWEGGGCVGDGWGMMRRRGGGSWEDEQWEDEQGGVKKSAIRRNFKNKNIQKNTMQVHVKLQGFKEHANFIFPIDVEPSDTIATIASRLQHKTGVPADTLAILTGLNISNPSNSYKKLDHGSTVAQHGLSSGSTLVAFVPASAQQETVAAKPYKQRGVCVGKAHYRASPSQPLKSGDIMAVVGSDGKSTTTLLYDGVEYSNAQEWVAKVFNNSGRSCAIQFERSQAAATPRPHLYLPPSDHCPFERYI